MPMVPAIKFWYRRNCGKDLSAAEQRVDETAYMKLERKTENIVTLCPFVVYNI